MEDSSQNPYIPQESQAIRSKTQELKSPLAKLVKILLIVTAIASVLVGGGLIYILPKTTVEDKASRIELSNVIQPTDQLTKLVPVSSDLGFKLSYENQLYTSYGKIGAASAKEESEASSGEYYENNDLRTQRNYNYVRISPVQSADANRSIVTQSPQFVLSATSTPDDIKAAAAKPEYKGLSQLSTFIKTDTDQRLSERTADDGTTVTIDASKPSARTINGVEYQKVRFSTQNDNYRIANVRFDDCYYTIQNAQPYAGCIENIRPNTVDAEALAERILNTVSYQALKKESGDEEATKTDETKPVSVAPTARLTQATPNAPAADATNDDAEDSTTEEADPVEASLVTKKPEYNDNPLSLKSIAKNQPSVVRIGTLYCAELALKFESGETGTTLTDACAGNVSSGAIVSSDGYVATTGHAIRYDPQAAVNGYINFAETPEEMYSRLQRILDYLFKAKILFQTDVDYLKTGVRTGDQDAIAKVENIGSIIPDNYISPVKEEYTYAVQPTDKPIVINRNVASKPTFAYSDTVVKASYVASNYDTKKSVQEKFGTDTPPVDTGLIKLDGNFQNMTVANGDDVNTNDLINTIGFPAYTNSDLSIDKLRNMPTVTFNKVEQTYLKDKQRVIQTTNPVLPGNDGAPVVDQSGSLVGFSVYGLAYCPDQDCFAKGTVRSSSELLAMVEKENVSLGGASQATTTWGEAIDAYFAGNYAAAKNKFASAGSAYSFNAMAAPLEKLSAAKMGTESDTSLFNQLTGVMIGLLVFLVVATIALAAAFIIHKKRIDSLRVGHYGTPAMASPVQQYAPVAQPLQQQAPQQWGQPQQPQQQWNSPTPTGQPQYQQQYPQPQSPTYPQQQTVDPYAQPPQQQPSPQPQQWGQPQQPSTPASQPQQQPPVSDDPFYRQ